MGSSGKSFNIAIVGTGAIGNKRAKALRSFPEDHLLAVADVVVEKAQRLATEFSCKFSRDWQAVVTDPEIDAVIVSTPNKFLAPIVILAAQNSKHILCEKPLGRNPEESRSMVQVAEENGVILKTGFNHRHHPAIWKARQMLEEGTIGEPFYARSVYGHGGRPGYDKEWRGDKELAGGGELLDQGVHVIDLCRWFLGEIVEVSGVTSRFYWDIVPLEDNGFAILRTGDGKVAVFHTSWTQWKNIFLFEIFGRNGYLRIQGLGGSYGAETLIWGRRKPQSGSPDEETFIFEGLDNSWIEEWREFRSAIEANRQPLGNGYDGLRAVEIVHAIYQSSESGKVVKTLRT